MNLVNLFAAEIFVPSVINPQTIVGFKEQLETINKKVRFIILRGTETVFCNGLDFKWISKIDTDAFTDEIAQFFEVMNILHTCEYITLAAVEGDVSGGGMGIASACDFVIASNKSRFSLPEGTLGIIPGIISPFLLNKLSAKQIKKMVFTGKKFSAQQMQEFDFVDDVVEPSELNLKLVETIKSMTSCKQQSVCDLKQLLKNVGIPSDDLYQTGLSNLNEKLHSDVLKMRFTALAEYFSD